MRTHLNAKNSGKILFLLCWMAYFTSYIGRLNYSSVMASVIDDGILTLSQAGAVSMVYFFAYGGGQLVNGILGDKAGPQYMIFAGLFCSGICNLFMGVVHTFFPMAVLWGINGYTQAMIWPPIIRIFAEKYGDEKKKRYSVDIASSMAAGTLASYFLSACAMKAISWHWAFFLAAGMLIAVALVWLIGYTKTAAVLPPVIREEKTALKVPQKEKKQAGFGKLILQGGLLVILFPVMIHGILKDGMTQWVPTYIYDRFSVTASFSVLVTMCLPIINLTGAYLAKFAERKNPNREIGVSGKFFGIAAGALILLLLFGKQHVMLTVALFAVITASMMAVNTLYVNLIPLHFEKQGRVSTVSGFLNSVAYIGSGISTFAIGVLVERFDWNVTIMTWIGITGFAFLICVGLRNRKTGF